MKVILDTNVVISGIFFSGPPFEILKAWRDKKITIILSEEIFDEYLRVCERLNIKFPSIEISEVLDLIALNAHFFQPIERKAPITADPDDDKFFTCALAADVSTIISGDKHLLDVDGYQGVEVLRPAEFIIRYLK